MRFILKNNNGFKFILFLLLLINTYSIWGQQDQFYQSHATYWYYRARLRNDFMLVGKGAGMSIPMQERGSFYYPYTAPNGAFYQFNSNPSDNDGQAAQWGDAMSDWGFYLGVLATEYKLLMDNGQSQSADSTLKELYYALYAYNRLDMNADPLYYAFAEPSSTPHPLPSNFDPSQPTANADLNGFSMRDDVTSDFVLNNYSHFNYYGNRGFCSNIKINNSYSAGNGPYLSGWSALYPGQNIGQDFHGVFISQDNWYDALVGLALVVKLVPQGITYHGTPFQDGETTIFQEVQNIVTRTYDYFNSHRTASGFITYPDGINIPGANGGYVGDNLFPHEEIVSRIRATPNKHDYYNPTENTGNAAFHDMCARHTWLNPNTGHHLHDHTLALWRASYGLGIRNGLYVIQSHTVSGYPNTGIIHENAWKAAYSTLHNSNVEPMNTNLLALCNCYYSFEANITGSKIAINEFDNGYNLYHAQLLRTVLNNYENCGHGEDNPYPSGEMSAVWSSLLSSAPCEPTYSVAGYTFHTSGPYAFQNASLGPMNPFYEWSTTSRMDHPQRRGAGNNTNPGEYNGLDYMLYHNLYFLLRKTTNNDNSDYLVDFTNRTLTLPYPLTTPNTNPGNPWGGSSNPALVGAYEVADVQCVFNNNSVVDIKAGKEIRWSNNFAAAQGCNVSNEIQHLVCTDIFNQNNNYDNVNGRSVVENVPKGYYESIPTQVDNSIKTKSLTQSVPIQHSTKSVIYSFERPSDSYVARENIADNTSIYPNPNDGNFILLVNNPKVIKSYELVNPMGQSVFLISKGIINENKIDISDMGIGVYLLKITDTDNKIWYKKVVKI